MKKKILLLVLAGVLLCGSTLFVTLAWLGDSDQLSNTFVAGNVNITLTESTGSDYKMVPAATVSEDPKLTVIGGSEACWIFLKIEETNDATSFLSYAVNSLWTPLPDHPNVYYRQQAETASDVAYYILEDNTITVKPEVTKAQMDVLTSANYPKLTFIGYAVQQLGFDTPQAAWVEAEKFAR